MISTTSYPYPVSDKSSVRRAALQPYIYSPSESHKSPRNIMYPHLHPSGSPSPTYIYPSYEHCYAKDAWMTATPSSWAAFYPLPPRSSSLPETAINPKVTVHAPPQPVLVSDIDTPSSISSHSVLTPSSPFAHHDVGVEFQAMEFDEFDCDDEEDYVDSDFADDMEGIDDAPSPLYGASAPHVIKSTSALEGALGDTLSSSYDSHLGMFTPADRRLSASVPGYPSASHRSTATTQQRWIDRTHSPAFSTSSPTVPETAYPSHAYTHRNYSSSTSLFAPTSPSLYNHTSTSSLAGAFTSRPMSNRLPILQPQPIRPIPPIPLAELASCANESSSPDHARAPRTLSPLPLLCQPVSDAVRYRFKQSPAGGGSEDICYEEDNASESMCEDDDLVAETQDDPFARRGLAFCPDHQPAGGPCSVEQKLCSCGYISMPIRWQ